MTLHVDQLLQLAKDRQRDAEARAAERRLFHIARSDHGRRRASS
jgi:hypothetical protein